MPGAAGGVPSPSSGPGGPPAVSSSVRRYRAERNQGPWAEAGSGVPTHSHCPRKFCCFLFYPAGLQHPILLSLPYRTPRQPSEALVLMPGQWAIPGKGSLRPTHTPAPRLLFSRRCRLFRPLALGTRSEFRTAWLIKCCLRLEAETLFTCEPPSVGRQPGRGLRAGGGGVRAQAGLLRVPSHPRPLCVGPGAHGIQDTGYYYTRGVN